MIKRFKIQGHSMEPTIKEGEIYFVANFSAPKVNDVVVFENKGMFLVKRVKKEAAGRFVLKGDNEGHSKEYEVEKGQIVGKLIFRYWPLKKIGFLKQS